MATIRQLQDATGFSREAITLRIKRFNLPADFDPKDVLELKPMNEAQKNKRLLEEERAELAHQQMRKAKVEADKAEGSVAPVEDVRADVAELLDTIAATVKTSGLAPKQQNELFSIIRKGGEAFDKKYGGA